MPRRRHHAASTAASHSRPVDDTMQTGLMEEEIGEPTAAPEDAAGDGAALQAQAEMDDLRQRLEELERSSAGANDRYLRTLADFDNFRKRKNVEMEDTRRYANEALIGDLLPVLDNFDRALQSSESQEDDDPVMEGVRLINRQLHDTLRKAGLEPIEALGEPFDPMVHEAIGPVEAEEGQPPNHVGEELRKGYKLHGRVVRAALVRVTA